MNAEPPPAATLRALGPLLHAMKLGEALSRDATWRQSTLAGSPTLARALRHQSRQEALHAGLFDAALRLVPGRHVCPPRLAAALDAFRSQLDRDLDAAGLAASMIGLQGFFEALGAAALQPPAGALARAADRLVPLRTLVLRQEEAHHRLGEIWIPRLLASSSAAGALERYAELSRRVVDAGLAELEAFSFDHARLAAAAAHALTAQHRLFAFHDRSALA